MIRLKSCPQKPILLQFSDEKLQLRQDTVQLVLNLKYNLPCFESHHQVQNYFFRRHQCVPHKEEYPIIGLCMDHHTIFLQCTMITKTFCHWYFYLNLEVRYSLVRLTRPLHHSLWHDSVHRQVQSFMQFREEILNFI